MDRPDPAADELPRAPQLGARRDPPRRRTAITQTAIVDAALEVMDTAGVEGLSMRKVAAVLGTGAGSLYAHVAGKEQLLELIWDELCGRVALPEPDPERWEEQLRQILRDFRTVFSAHRDAALAALGRFPTTPKVLTGAEVMAALLRAGGLPDDVIALGLDQLLLHVTAVALEDSLYRHGDRSPEEIARYIEEAHAFYAALPPAQFPVMTSLAGAMTGPGIDERFEFGLDVLIAGLKAAAERRAAAGS